MELIRSLVIIAASMVLSNAVDTSTTLNATTLPAGMTLSLAPQFGQSSSVQPGIKPSTTLLGVITTSGSKQLGAGNLTTIAPLAPAQSTSGQPILVNATSTIPQVNPVQPGAGNVSTIAPLQPGGGNQSTMAPIQPGGPLAPAQSTPVQPILVNATSTTMPPAKRVRRGAGNLTTIVPLAPLVPAQSSSGQPILVNATSTMIPQVNQTQPAAGNLTTIAPIQPGGPMVPAQSSSGQPISVNATSTKIPQANPIQPGGGNLTTIAPIKPGGKVSTIQPGGPMVPPQSTPAAQPTLVNASSTVIPQVNPIQPGGGPSMSGPP